MTGNALRKAEIQFLGLPDAVNAHWRQYACNLQIYSELDVSPFVRFVVEARKRNVAVDFADIEEALPLEDWESEVIEQTCQTLTAIQATLSVLGAEYGLMLPGETQ